MKADEKNIFYSQQLIPLDYEQFKLKYSFRYLPDAKDVTSFFDFYEKEFCQAYQQPFWRKVLYFIILLFCGGMLLFFGLMLSFAAIMMSLEFIGEFINQPDQGTNIALFKTITEYFGTSTEDINELPSYLHLLYIISIASSVVLLLAIVGIVIPLQISSKILQKSHPDKRRNSIKWKKFHELLKSLRDNEVALEGPQGEESIVDRYIGVNENQSIYLKAIDPDWEIQDIISIFTKNWDIPSLVYVTFWITFVVFAMFSGWVSNGIAGLIMLLVIYGCVPTGFYTIGVDGRGGHIRSSWRYIQIRSYLIDRMRSEVINLSNKETIGFSMEKASLEEIDIKLDLLSARSTLETLQNLPILPNIDKIILIAKLLGYTSLLSIIISFFTM